MTQSSLNQFILDSVGESHLRVETDFGDGFVRLRSGEAERRQAAQDIRCVEDALIELLRNARDAHARRIYICSERKGNLRELTILDDGDGVPAKMHKLIFEPRVTSKLDSFHADKWGVHGRGMALFSIAENTVEARVVESNSGIGTSLKVVADTNVLKERKDQSTFPQFALDESGVVKVLGPRNLLRCACEFALEARSHTDVFMGSATEIAASLYEHGNRSLPAELRIFDNDSSELGICDRIACSYDPASFAAACIELGLDISERSARRILDGQITAAPNILSRIVLEGTASKCPPQSQGRRSSKKGKIAISNEDLNDLAQKASDAFNELATSYYLHDAEASISVRDNKIVISIPLIRDSL